MNIAHSFAFLKLFLARHRPSFKASWLLNISDIKVLSVEIEIFLLTYLGEIGEESGYKLSPTLIKALLTS